LEQR
jgi:type VI protein secretion system component VasF